MSNAPQTPVAESFKPYSSGIYVLLPFVFAGIALMVVLGPRDVMGAVSGLALAVAGMLVLLLRLWRRQSQGLEQRMDFLPTAIAPEEVSPSQYAVSWSPSFECGHPVLDQQHQQLAELVNGLIQTCVADERAVGVEALLDQVIEQITDHFCAEEVILVPMGIDPLNLHREQHRQLLAKARDLRQRCANGQARMQDMIAFIANDVLANHMLKEVDRWNDAANRHQPVSQRFSASRMAAA